MERSNEEKDRGQIIRMKEWSNDGMKKRWKEEFKLGMKKCRTEGNIE